MDIQVKQKGKKPTQTNTKCVYVHKKLKCITKLSGNEI